MAPTLVEFYRKRALYTLHFSNAYSCNYMNLFSECLTDLFIIIIIINAYNKSEVLS